MNSWLYIKKFAIGALSIFKGFNVTLKNMFKKPVTLNYPNKKQPMKERFRGMVDLYPEDCVICYQCIRICPTAALDLAHLVKEDKKKEITKFTFNAELCCFCGLCDLYAVLRPVIFLTASCTTFWIETAFFWNCHPE